MEFKDIISQYEAGDIVELEVVKILAEPQLIIFDLNGVSARLHVSNFSNNFELSRKLFNVVRVGETITSVIVDFNKEKSYVELSLKPFRNQLEGSLSFTRCKKVVEKRYAMRTELHSDILEENRNQLDRIQGDLARVDLTFLYELIQNAIDHPNREFNNLLNIKFEVYNEYLLLKHNGSIFNEDNFRSLTGILLGENENEQDRIGYKGIGFKSIFRYTQEVYVRSGNFSFSFSKSRSGAKSPWEVIPLFENEIDKVEEIKNFEFFNTPVAFAFKFTNDELKDQAISYLEALLDNPQSLLFLDNLGRLEIVIDGEVKTIKRTLNTLESHDRVILQFNEEDSREWLICEEQALITDEVIINELKDENNPSIPLKFRSFRTPKVQIAYPITPVSDLINIYTYLPLSETKFGLPYIINGDFIPNLDRTDFIKNLKYNVWLATLAAKALSKLFYVLSDKLGIEQSLTLVPEFKESNSEFINLLNSTFILEQDSLKVSLPDIGDVTLKSFIIDKSDVFSIISKDELHLLEPFKSYRVLPRFNSDIEDRLISKLGLGAFNMENARELLLQPQIVENYYSSFSELVVLYFRFSRLKNGKSWVEELSGLKLISQNGKWHSFSELYLGIPEGFEEMFDEILNMRALHRDNNSLLLKYPRVTDLLVKFGLNKFDLSSALHGFIRNVIRLSGVAGNEYVNQFWHFLFLNRDVLNADGSRLVNDRFKLFPIRTIDGNFEVLERCVAGKVDHSAGDFSFLYKHVGEKHLQKVDVDVLAESCNVSASEIVAFLSSIHVNVRVTEKSLFKEAYKKITTRPHGESNLTETALIEGLRSLFFYYKKYPDDNIFDKSLYNFPALSKTGLVVHVAYLYFDESFSDCFKSNELYAVKVFQNVEGIEYISDKYIEGFTLEEKLDFVAFLLKCQVSPGLKYFKASEIKDGYRINLNKVDTTYAAYNNGYSNFESDNEFYIFKDINKIHGLFENLTVFWSKLSEISPQNLISEDIVCNGYKRPNPLIWLIRQTPGMFPMRDGSIKSYVDIYSIKLKPFLLSPDENLHDCFTEKLEGILNKMELNSKLSSKVIIKSLQNLSTLSEKDREELIMKHFISANYSEEEFGIIKETGFLIGGDDTPQLISQLIYVDADLENTSLILSNTTFSKNRIIKTFEYNQGFKNKVVELSIPIFGAKHIQLRSFEKSHSDFPDDLNGLIFNFGLKQGTLDSKLSFIKESTFIPCESIIVGLDNLPDFHSTVDGYYDEDANIFYFSGIRDLIDLLCEQFDWSLTDNRKLRSELRYLESRNAQRSSEKEQIGNPKYSSEEIDQIKKLFGRDLQENELLEDNLYAQVKALRYFKDKDYDVSQAEDNFQVKYKDKFLYPIIDSDGNVFRVMCRSARQGVLFLGAYAWLELEKRETLLYILTGDKSTDCIEINTQDDLEKELNSHYKVIRRINTNADELRTLLRAESNLKELQLLYKVKNSEFDLIFNPQQNKPGVTEGPLIDIGADI